MGIVEKDKRAGVESDSLFAIMLVLGRVLGDNYHWPKVIMELEGLLNEYSEVQIECVGFPQNRREVLLSDANGSGGCSH